MMVESQLSRRQLIASATATGFAIAGAAAYLNRSSSLSALAQDPGVAVATPVALGPAMPEEFTLETNWPFENGPLIATRDAKGSTISASTIATLGDAWSFRIAAPGFFGALTANPTVVGDVIFIQDTAANIYALNKVTGEQIWANIYNDAVPSGGPNGTANAYGLLFTTLGGFGDVIALKADSGEEVWRTNILGPLNEGITTAPTVYDNVVYVSTIPGSSVGFYAGGMRGLIFALDAASGTVLWYLDTTTDNLWGNPTVNSGGGFWHPPSVDENGKLYVGIGNAAPYPGAEGFPFGSSRPGDNDYANCILKIDPATATLDWYYNAKPHDLFDLDNQVTPVLADIDGRKVVFTSGKHGFVISLDRDSGEVVWRTPVGTHQNDERTEIADGEIVTVLPGTLGGVETPLAYSAAANLVIAPVYELPSTYIGTGFDPNTPFDFTTATGFLVALNGSDGTVAWQVPLASGPLAGVTITNDVLFSAGLDGVIFAYNLTDGVQVWKYQASAGINTSPAVSGDYIYFAAGGPLIPSAATMSPPPEAVSQVIALKIGGDVQAPFEGGTGEATPQSEASPVANSGIALDLLDIRFEPNALTIPAGQDVQITLTNKGALPHTFTIDDPAVASGDVAPGATVTVTVNALAGTYEFYCSVPGHRDAGMFGTLTVQ